MPKIPNKKYFIGIDIGKDGAIAVQNNVDKNVDLYKMPLIKTEYDLQTLNKILRYFKGKDCHVVFEDISNVFVKSSAKGMISFGKGAGFVEMGVVAHELPFTIVSAKTWQKEMFTGVKEVRVPTKDPVKTKNGKPGKIDTKAMALIVAKRLFPTETFLPTKRSSVPDNGMVDAILMSEFCKRRNF